MPPRRPPCRHLAVAVDRIDVPDGPPRCRSLQFNEKIAAEVARVGEEQKLIADACVEFDRDTLVEALCLDALVPNREIASRLVAEMVKFQREYIFSDGDDERGALRTRCRILKWLRQAGTPVAGAEGL